MRLPSLLAPSVLVLVTVALAGCIGSEPGSTGLPGLPFIGGSAPPALGFGPGVVVDPELGGSEPSLVVDHEGRVFVAAPTGLGPGGDPVNHKYSGQFWRSTDGGASFEHLEGLGLLGLYGPSIGGGDSDIAVDAQGNLYAIDLWLGNVGLLTSQDHGDSWLRGSPVTFAASGTDRQWVDVNQATGDVYITVNSLSTGLWVIRSDDAGLTFPQQTLAVPHADRGGCICPPGAFAVDEVTGNIYLPYYNNPQGVGLAISTDGGSSFRIVQIPGSESARLPGENEAGGAFTVITHDTEGNLYLVYESVTDAGRRIVLQTSTDQGASWSVPLLVSPLVAGYQIFPWVVAGEPGRVAVAWYEVTGEDWNVRLAYAQDGLAAEPRFGVTKLNDEPVLKGGYDRGTLGDFFEIALGPEGEVHAVWNAKTADGQQLLVYAKQSEGPRLLTGAPAPEPAARKPMQPPSLPPVRPTDPEEVAMELAAEAGKLLEPGR